MPSKRARVCLLLLAGMAAACQVAPAPASDSATRGIDVALARDVDAVEGRVPTNATLESLLRQHKLSAELTAAVVQSIRGVFNPRELRAEQTYRLTRSLDGLFREFRYQIDADRLLRVVSRAGSGGPSGGFGDPSGGSGNRSGGSGNRSALRTVPVFDAEVLSLPKEIEVDALSAPIARESPSLVGALEASGENVQLALGLAEIFGGEIDFNSDLQPGDRIEVLFERFKRDGEFIGYGSIKAAVLMNEGRRITGIGFTDADGKLAWYDEDGRSLKRQFLQSPLPFDPRVTSKFSYRRLHPVHGTRRAHLGVDYGAPSGTRVNAVASGVVELAGWSGGAGRMVRLRHGGGYRTAYLHLSSIAAGLRPGVRVEQGAIIGRVGSSGTATGPHLDYRISRNGTYVNPLVELKKMPKGEPVSPHLRAVFLRGRDEALDALRQRIAR